MKPAACASPPIDPPTTAGAMTGSVKRQSTRGPLVSGQWAPGQWVHGLLAYGGLGLLSGAVTTLALQGLLTRPIEQQELQRLAQETAFSIRLTELALERYPRSAVAQLSGLVLEPRPPRSATPSAPAAERLQGQARQFRTALCRELGSCRPLVVRRHPQPGAWVELDSLLEPTWLFTPLPATRLWPPHPLVLSLALVVGALVSSTAYLTLEVRRPLRLLQRHLAGVDLEVRANPLPERGTPAVRRLTQQLNAMLDRLEQGRRERATMLAGIAHDLGSPLTRLRLRLQLAQDRALPAADLNRAHADLDALARITAQFVAYAAGPAGEAPLPVALDAVIGQALGGVEAPLELDLQALQRTVRPGAIGRAVSNLVENALEHGRPPLRITLEPDGAEGFLIGVWDCGEGIPPELWGRAREPFQRLDAARGGQGHCGLGLAIADQVARAHGGGLELAWARPEDERAPHLSLNQQTPPCPQPQNSPQRFGVLLRGLSQPVTSGPLPGHS